MSRCNPAHPVFQTSWPRQKKRNQAYLAVPEAEPENDRAVFVPLDVPLNVTGCV
jgi:hypothetical protein